MNRSLVAVLQILILIFVGSFVSTAQAQGASQALVLDLRVRESVPSADPGYVLDLVLTNRHAHRRVTLRGELGFYRNSGIVVEITDPNGVKQTLTPKLGDFTLTDEERNQRVAFIEPGEGIGLSRTFRASEIRTVPGRYQLQVNFRSPLPTPASQRANTHGRPDDLEGSTVSSNSVEIVLN